MRFLCLFFVYVTAAFADVLPDVCPEIITKAKWGGKTALEVEYVIIPAEYVVIHHTVTQECDTQEKCIEMMETIQNFHMETLNFHDIGYNFVIGGDGRVYEGAGWHKVGAHTRGYNTKSVGIAFLGTFTSKMPNDKQMKAFHSFLDCAVELGEISKNYKLLGARQVSSTQSPGLKLYIMLKSLPHFVQNP